LINSGFDRDGIIFVKKGRKYAVSGVVGVRERFVSFVENPRFADDRT
jgi:hypothetical protein